MTTSALTGLVEHAYRAAGDAHQWNGVVSHMATALGADSGLLFSPGDHFLLQPLHAHNYDFATAQAYGDYYHRHDVWDDTAKRKGIYQTGLAVRGDQLVSPSVLRKTLFYNEFLRHMDQESLLCSVLFDEHSARGVPPTVLSFYRRPGRGPFGKGVTTALQKALPHLQHCLTLHHELLRARAQNMLHEAALDQVSAGVILLDANHRIRFANRSAEALLSQRNLHPVLMTALTTLGRQALAGQFAGRLLHTPQGMVYALASTPREAGTLCHNERGCVVWLVHATQRPHNPLSLIGQMFALTPAEHKVLGLLLDGHSPKNIASQLQTELSTVRSQLSAILHKTGTRRQQELLQLVAAFPVA